MREIEDNRVFFVITVIFAVAVSASIVWGQYYNEDYSWEREVKTSVWVALFGTMAFCGMGVAQMYGDRTKKISALLATLAVSRLRIFMARVAAGGLLVLAGLLPIFVTMMVMSSALAQKMPVIIGPAFGMWVPIFMLCFACYCIGLQAGWTLNKTLPTLGAIAFSFVLMGIIMIKGVGPDIYAIVVVFTAGCLLRAWHTYSTAAF
jgi:hypothetical protein